MSAYRFFSMKVVIMSNTPKYCFEKYILDVFNHRDDIDLSAYVFEPQSLTRPEAHDLLSTWSDLQNNHPGLYSRVLGVMQVSDGTLYLELGAGEVEKPFHIYDFINNVLEDDDEDFEELGEFLPFESLNSHANVGVASVDIVEKLNTLLPKEEVVVDNGTSVTPFETAQGTADEAYRLIIGEDMYSDDDESTQVYEEDEDDSPNPVYYSIKINRTGQVFRVIHNQTTTIGRGSTCEVRITDNKNISRNHAKLIVNDSGELVLEDLKSANKTYFNSQPISRPVILDVGSSFELFKEELIVVSKGVL